MHIEIGGHLCNVTDFCQYSVTNNSTADLVAPKYYIFIKQLYIRPW